MEVERNSRSASHHAMELISLHSVTDSTTGQNCHLLKDVEPLSKKKEKEEEKEKGKRTFKRENANKRHSVNTMLVSLSSNGM